MKLDIKDAAFSYNGTDNVFCILGPNGTGKSTLFKSINGISKLNQGDGLLGGKNIHSLDKTGIAKKLTNWQRAGYRLLCPRTFQTMHLSAQIVDDVIIKDNLKRTYGVDATIVHVDEADTTVCVPMKNYCSCGIDCYCKR